MKVQTAPNGWPGIFIPGDEAIGLGRRLDTVARLLESENIRVDQVAIFLRNTASELMACRVEGGI